MESVTCEHKIYDGPPVHPTFVQRYYSGVVNQRVLDVGCGSGRLGEALQQLGNTCIGITVSETEASIAKTRLSDVIVADLETVERLPLPEQFFDVLIFADVLEHLRDPGRVLQMLKPHLKRGGRIIASIPNVANIEVRWNLFLGRFDYQPTGILDNTHLRFYTMRSARVLIEGEGYRVAGVQFTNWNWQLPRPILAPLRWLDRDWQIREWLTTTWPGLFATQFVIEATL